MVAFLYIRNINPALTSVTEMLVSIIEFVHEFTSSLWNEELINVLQA